MFQCKVCPIHEARVFDKEREINRLVDIIQKLQGLIFPRNSEQFNPFSEGTSFPDLGKEVSSLTPQVHEGYDDGGALLSGNYDLSPLS